MSGQQPAAWAHGQGMLEYAIVLSLIAVVVFVAVTFVGRSAKSPLCSVAGSLGGGLSNYSKAVLSDCPEAYWRMGERSGTVAADSSGHNHPGTYNGTDVGTVPVTFGQDLGSRFLNGWLDEAAVYNTALTPAQVMAHCAASGA